MKNLEDKYFKASADAFEKIDAIHMALYAHGRKFDGLNWGFVGDLNNLNELLQNIIDNLTDAPST